jgi:peroxiredoxin
MNRLAAVMICVWLGWGAAQAQELKSYSGATPPLKLKDIQGKTHALVDYRGSVVMVQFWATYCAPCIKEMPSMQRLQVKLADKPFKILAVNMGETDAEVREFVKRVNVDFTILMDGQGEALAAWKVFVAPSTFIVDPDGRIRYTLQGGAEWDEAQYVEKLGALMKK